MKRRPPPPTPVMSSPVYSQTEQRERRRQHLGGVIYGATFDLAAEIRGVAEPFAACVARHPRPLALRRAVEHFADCAHELTGVVAEWLAEADARQRTSHLAHEPTQQRLAVRTFIDLAPRPALPTITDDSLIAGTWAASLVDMAAEVSDDLAELLGRSLLPDSPRLRGVLSRSDRLADLLRRTLDRAALELDRRIQTVPTVAVERDPQAEARARLAAMGVTAP